jgi:ribosomal protein S18 acetylase RimI-like enzyme
MSGQVQRARVEVLGPDAPEALFAALDGLARAARAALIPPGAELEPLRARAADAEGDPRRLLLVARAAERPLGFLDGELPESAPGDLLVAQIAVARGARRRGVARALLRAGLARARARGRPVERLVASVLPGADAAQAFWDHLGFEADGERFVGRPSDLSRESPG